MGYDIIKVICPNCGNDLYFQSKSGPCDYEQHDLATCPENILFNVNRHSPYLCDKCNKYIYVDEKKRVAKIETCFKSKPPKITFEFPKEKDV